ncbi:beta-lactamase/transpeptidase-like protein [Diplogelasinospora grovesii]|uniref:Beta-lactamase/transpeptidase-like protein n=1 Tax=Diplogelasinospora grovesii TaxID=303347 RepID=A0AAN6MUC5_9PEZI|nr:beta-lactamase/transpeptidase-like protein [Diplogelasinospora grovesii]
MKPDLTGRLQALDPIIKAICSATGAPGLSLGVARGGSIFHTAHYGYRDVEKALPPDSDTAYGVASLTKSFVASAMGIVVDEGRLSWTTPVKNILPELNSQDPLVTEQLTITDLFIHNTGLASSNHWWYGADGELLLRKDQTLAAFKALKQKGKFRAQYSYSNWPYCVAGEVIEKVSGQSFGTFLQQRILGPLHLSRTSAAHDNNSDQNLAKPYAVLDNGEAFLLPFPKTGDGQIMAPAQAVRSSVNDMLKYGSALLEAQKAELAAGQTLPESNPLRGAATQLSAHITKTAQSPEFLLERTYGFGMERFQLPQAVDGVGCNSMFVKQMPKLVPGPNSKGGLLLVHTGSIAGYSSMLALLPEHDIVAFAVANSVGLGDPSGWVVQALVETISESENTTDFVSLAKEAAANHARREVDNMKVLEDHRTPDTQPRPLDEYVGTYVGLAGLFGILIRRRRRSAGEEGLEVLFQGLESQAWPLTHYHFDTFTWIQPFNEQARRARFNLVGPDLFKIRFMAGEEEEEGNGKTGETVIDRVCWMQEPGLLEKDQCFLREKKELRRQL